MSEIKTVEVGVVAKLLLEEAFNRSETEKILLFLEKGFSENGVMSIVTLFLRAHDVKRSVNDVLPLVEEKWKTVWTYQHPSLRANPHKIELFAQNRNCYRELYENLGIPVPEMFDRKD